MRDTLRRHDSIRIWVEWNNQSSRITVRLNEPLTMYQETTRKGRYQSREESFELVSDPFDPHIKRDVCIEWRTPQGRIEHRWEEYYWHVGGHTSLNEALHEIPDWQECD